MADLAELGIRVRYIDDKASKKLKDVEGQAQRTKKATDKLGSGTKRASDQMTQSYTRMQQNMQKLQKEYARLKDSPKALADLKKQLSRVDAAARKAADSGDMTFTRYKKLAKQSDRLRARINEQSQTLKKNAASYQEADNAAKQYNQRLKQQQAVQSRKADEKARERQRRRELDQLKSAIKTRHENAQALDRQRQQYKAVAADYEKHDRLAQQYNERLRNTGKASKASSKQVVDSMGRMESAIQRVSQRIVMFGSFMVAAFVLTGIQQSVRSFIQTIGDFDQALYNLQAITKATRQESEVMGDTIRNVARSTKFSAGEVADGMRLIGQAGFSAGQSMQAIQAVANLATGTMEDFSNVVDLVTTTIRAFNLETVESGRVSDIFATAINESKLNIDKLRKAFNYVGAAGRQAGLTLEETSGALMILANNGIRASTMGTGLRRMLLSLVSPNVRLRAALDSVGMELEEINPKMVGMETTLDNLAKLMWDNETQTVDMGKAMDYFGVRAAQVAAILGEAAASGGAFAKAVEKTRDVGAASRMAELQQKGLVVQFKNLQDRAKNVALTLGDAGFLDVMKGVVNALRSGAKSAEEFFEAVPEAAQVAGMTTVFGGLGVAIAGIGTAAKYASGILTTFWATLTSPITIAAATLAGLVSIIIKHRNEVQKSADAHAKHAIEVRKGVEALEGWNTALESAAKEGAKAYNNAIMRFIKEQDDLANSILKSINNAELFNEQIHSLDQIIAKVGFEKASDIISRFFDKQKIKERRKEIALLGQDITKLNQQIEWERTKPERMPGGLIGKWLGQVDKKKIKKLTNTAQYAIEEMAREATATAVESGEGVERAIEEVKLKTDWEDWTKEQKKHFKDFADDLLKKYDEIDEKQKEVTKEATPLPESIVERLKGLSVEELFEFSKARKQVEKDMDEMLEFLEDNKKQLVDTFGFTDKEVEDLWGNLVKPARKKRLEEELDKILDKEKDYVDERKELYEHFYDTVGNMNTDFVRELQDAVRGGEVGRVEDLVPLASSELKRKIEKNNQKLEDSRKLLVLIGADGSAEFAKASEQVTKLEYETAKLKKQFGELDEQEAMAEFNKEADRFDDKVETIYNKHGEGTDKAQRKVNALVEKYKSLILALGVSGSEVEEFIKKLNEAADPTGFERVLEVFDDFEKEVGSGWKQLADVTDSTLQHMEDALTDWIMKGKLKWKEFARAVIAEIVRVMIVQQTMRQATNWASSVNWGSLFTGNTWAGSPGGAGFIGKAEGGPVKSGTSYVVGERGPEIFTPQQSGNITPNDQISAAPNLQVNVIDNTSEKKDVSKEEPKWNGEKWVMNVVLDAANRNKSGFRNGMKAALNK